MRIPRARRQALWFIAAAVLLGAAGVALAGSETGHHSLTAAKTGSALGAIPYKQRSGSVPDGCTADSPTDGTQNSGQDIVCGGPGNDVLKAGPTDIVRGGGGDDTIYASNGGPNWIDGGLGSDTAWIDPSRGGKRLDTTYNVQYRHTQAMTRPVSQTPPKVTPDGFPYELPTVQCDTDDNGNETIDLLVLQNQAPQMEAYDENPDVVDWQNVAWSTLIYKAIGGQWVLVDQFDWTWDRTYDGVDFKQKVRPQNIWRSYVDGEDSDPYVQDPFIVTEGGDYLVRFKYHWYSERATDPSLKPMPSGDLFTQAKKVLGDYARSSVSTPSYRYCRFPTPTTTPTTTTGTTTTAAAAPTFKTGTYKAVQGQYTATWKVTVGSDGRIAGTSDWTCCPGPRTDPLTGNVTGSKVVITRDCRAGNFAACIQVFTGTVGTDGKVTGTWAWSDANQGTGGTFSLTPG